MYGGSCIFAKPKKKELIALFIEYLSVAKKIPLQGVGELCVVRTPAQVDIPERQVTPPATQFHFNPTAAVSGKDELIGWTAKKMGIPQAQAELNYDQYIKNWQSELQQKKLVAWNGIGTWQLDNGNALSFQPELSPTYEGLPVHAEKVVRENAAHQVRVGEDQRSSVEMTALLNSKKKKLPLDIWLGVAALALALLFWALYLMQQPITPSSIGNPRKVLMHHR